MYQTFLVYLEEMVVKRCTLLDIMLISLFLWIRIMSKNLKKIKWEKRLQPIFRANPTQSMLNVWRLQWPLHFWLNLDRIMKIFQLNCTNCNRNIIPLLDSTSTLNTSKTQSNLKFIKMTCLKISNEGPKTIWLYIRLLMNYPFFYFILSNFMINTKSMAHQIKIKNSKRFK